jgi:hypothetical protein
MSGLKCYKAGVSLHVPRKVLLTLAYVPVQKIRSGHFSQKDKTVEIVDVDLSLADH